MRPSLSNNISQKTYRLHNAFQHFSASASSQTKNRIYPSRIRTESELDTLTLMSASTRIPLITLWVTTWCPSCKVISPLVQNLIRDEGIGESQGGLSFVEVEMDSPDLGGVAGLAMRYGITSVPTLLAFDRQEAQVETRVGRVEDLKRREFLVGWLEKEAGRRGEGGGGGSILGGWFGR